MQTRLAVPYDKEQTNITTSKADFTVRGGTLRVPRNSELEFSVDAAGSRGARWHLKMTHDENLQLMHSSSPTGELEPVARLNSETGRLEVESLGATDLILTDHATGAPTRIYVDNGKICVEEL